MNTLKIRNLELGTGIPAICIPNVGKTRDEIIWNGGQTGSRMLITQTV